MAGAPVGNTNGAKRNRLLGDAMKRELVQKPEDAVAIVRKAIEAAKAGEPWAQQLVWDRTDGKLAQSIIGGDEDEPPVRVEGRIKLVRPE